MEQLAFASLRGKSVIFGRENPLLHRPAIPGIPQSRIASDGASFVRNAGIASIPFYGHYVASLFKHARSPGVGPGSGGRNSGQGGVNFNNFAL